MKFRYWQAHDHQWYWHLRARNGKIIAQSEGYRRRASCLKTIRLIRARVSPATPIINRDDGDFSGNRKD